MSKFTSEQRKLIAKFINHNHSNDIDDSTLRWIETGEDCEYELAASRLAKFISNFIDETTVSNKYTEGLRDGIVAERELHYVCSCGDCFEEPKFVPIRCDSCAMIDRDAGIDPPDYPTVEQLVDQIISCKTDECVKT